MLQTQTWSVFGPIVPQAGDEAWGVISLSGGRLPRTLRIAGRAFEARQVRLGPREHSMDFASLFDKPCLFPQAFAATRLRVAEAATLTVVFDADWCTTWWLDGREVFHTREGNGGPVGRERHRFGVALGAGSHTLGVRVQSGVEGWRLILHTAAWRRGIREEVRTDRGARWRDYRRAVVRIEDNPPPPVERIGGLSIPDYEHLLARLGVDAHWIKVFRTFQGPYLEVGGLPVWREGKPEHDRQAREWVDAIHRHRMSAASWFALTRWGEAWQRHPEWRYQYLVPPDPQTCTHMQLCCPNTPFGDALIRFLIACAQRYDLDCLWIDGAGFSNLHDTPQGIACVCPHCRRKFKRDTGLDLPERYDWTDPAFRRWVAWRYDMFGAFWVRLTDEVQRAVPGIAVAFNHYHREGKGGWNGAIPLRLLGRRFISAIEADGEPLRGACYTRLMRAYGREDTEVWMGAPIRRTTRCEEGRTRPMFDFALSCATAGGHSSLAARGTTHVALAELSRELRQREPYVGLPSVPFCALHVSQQTETFVYGRNPEFVARTSEDYYWNSVVGWHHLLAHAGLTCDVAFDDHLARPDWLRRYPILIMPLAHALTRAQVEAILRYVREGGTLVTGPWFGIADEWGEPHPAPLGDRTLFPFGATLPSWEQLKNRPATHFRADDKDRWLRVRPLTCLARGSRFTLKPAPDNPALCATRLGRGRIVQLAADAGTLYRHAPAPGIVAGCRDLMGGLGRQRVEVERADGLIFGLFRKGRKTTVVHVQQFPPPWSARATERPPAKWGVVLRWHGSRLKRVYCALPEAGPVLKTEPCRGGCRVALPPFVWGQIVVWEEE